MTEECQLSAQNAPPCEAVCSSGAVTGGGWQASENDATFAVSSSYPSGADRWTVTGGVTGQGTVVLTVYAICGAQP